MTPLSRSPYSSSLCPSLPSILLPSPSAPPGGDPSPGVNPGFPGPDSDLHLCGHRRPHPHHQLAAQLGPHSLSSQVQLWAWVEAGTVGRLSQWPRPNPASVSGPARVTVTSEGGRSTLTIRDVKEADQGAYTCEAINARGMVFGIPDGVLELVPQRGTTNRPVGTGHGAGARAACWGAGSSPLLCRPAGPCPDGHFYLEHSASCLPCFCFGVTNMCQSSRRFRDQIRLRFDQPGDFKGALAGGRALWWAPGSSQLREKVDMGEQPVLDTWGQVREGHKVADEMLSPVRRAFLGGKQTFLRKSQIQT